MALEPLTREQVRAKYLELEKQGRFDVHVDPIDFDIAMKVDGSFHYFPESFKERFDRWKIRTFGVAPFMRKTLKRDLELEVVGKENIKGIQKAIVVCNHVQMFDCLAVKYAMKPRFTHTVAASFNNMKGAMGDAMRAEGMMPLPNEFKDMKRFEDALGKALSLNRYVLIFAEQSEWWYYEKPRPYKDGAFYYAAKFDVPVIPCFITFKDRKKPDRSKEGMYPKGMKLNVLKPVFPLEGCSRIENREYLKNNAFEAVKDCYESYYGRKLEY